MTALTLYHNGSPLVRQRLRADRISIGSHPENDLILKGDGVCERHLVLSRGPEGQWTAAMGEGRDTALEEGTRLSLGSFCLELGGAGEEPAPPAGEDPNHNPGNEMVGVSLDSEILRRHIERLAPLEGPVLVEGETGTGKELVARALHRLSGRPSDRFVAVNCGGLADTMFEDILFGHERGAFTGASAAHRGLFERADGGTLFLDELGELPSRQQAALLRVLDSGRFVRLGSERETEARFRLVAATNRDLPSMVRAGRFRSDLYHRLSALVIRTTPLRARLDDLEPMSRHFLACMRRELGEKSLGRCALDKLRTHTWPGNARELRNVLYRAAAMFESPLVEARHITFDLPESTRRVRGVRLAEIPDDHIAEIMEKNDNNITRTARQLGVPRSSLRDRLRKVGGLRRS